MRERYTKREELREGLAGRVEGGDLNGHSPETC